MKIGYTNRVLDIIEIERITSDDKNETYLTPEVLKWVLKYPDIYGLIIARSDDGGYIAHAVFDFAQATWGRAECIAFYLNPDLRNPWDVFYLWHRFEEIVRKRGVTDITIHIAEHKTKWKKAVMTYGRFKEIALIENYYGADSNAFLLRKTGRDL